MCTFREYDENAKASDSEEESDSEERPAKKEVSWWVCYWGFVWKERKDCRNVYDLICF